MDPLTSAEQDASGHGITQNEEPLEDAGATSSSDGGSKDLSTAPVAQLPDELPIAPPKVLLNILDLKRHPLAVS